MDQKEPVDKLSADFSGERNNEYSNVCLQQVESFTQRYSKLISMTDWNYSSEKSFELVISLLEEYGINNIWSYWEVDLEEFSYRLRDGDFEIIEELFISKKDELQNNNLDELEIQLRVSELVHLTYASVQMFDVIIMNPSCRDSIKKSITLMKKYFLRIFNTISWKISQELINGLKQEVFCYLDVANVIVNSEIPMDGNNSKWRIEKLFESKMNQVDELKKRFNQPDFSDPHMISMTKNQFLKRSHLLKFRLSLQFNTFQQAAHFNTKCKLDKKQYNITNLKEEHNLWIYWLIELFSEISWKKIESTDLSAEHLNNLDLNVIELIRSKNCIQSVLDIFIDLLKSNHQDIWVLFEIVEAILYFSTNVDKQMVKVFQREINKVVKRNNRFQTWDLFLFEASIDSLYKNKDDLLIAHKESKIDSLTWIWNRKNFDESLDIFISKANHSSAYHGIMLFDIDKFKLINDKYWHPWWDAVLWTLASIVSSEIRNWVDQFYRVWWEEFSILFEVENEEWAQVFIEKIRSAVERRVAAEVRKKNKWKSLWDLHDVTISIWYVQVPKDNYVYDWVLNDVYVQADNALYFSKENGRNQSTKYTEDLDK